MDPIADMLAAIKNAQAVGKESVRLPFSRLKCDIATQLLEAGFLDSVEKKGRKTKRVLEVGLKFTHGKGAISNLKRVSKPGRRVYKKASNLHEVRQGYGAYILSTPQGIMTDKAARKGRVGGEVLVEVW